jgi:hypothetical protein
VEVHRDPHGVGQYRNRLILTAADRLAIPASQSELDLAALFALLPI